MGAALSDQHLDVRPTPWLAQERPGLRRLRAAPAQASSRHHGQGGRGRAWTARCPTPGGSRGWIGSGRPRGGGHRAASRLSWPGAGRRRDHGLGRRLALAPPLADDVALRLRERGLDLQKGPAWRCSWASMGESSALKAAPRAARSLTRTTSPVARRPSRSGSSTTRASPRRRSAWAGLPWPPEARSSLARSQPAACRAGPTVKPLCARGSRDAGVADRAHGRGVPWLIQPHGKPASPSCSQATSHVRSS